MFDVVWANPDRELVGQRKARKEREKERRDTYSSGNHSSNRSVASVNTETSSLRSRKPHSFLESIRLKKKKPKKQDVPSFSTGSRLSAFSDNPENRDSILAPPSLASSLGRSASVQYGDGSNGSGSGSASGQMRDRFFDSSSSQNRSSQDESILSKWTIPNSLATMLSVDEDTELELRTKDGRTITSITTTGSDIVQTVLRLRGEPGHEVHTPGSRYMDFDRRDSDIPQVPPLTPMASPQKSLQSPLTPKSMASTRRRKKKTSPPQLQIQRTGNKQQHDAFTSPEIRPLSVRSSATSWNPSDTWENNSLPAPLKVGIKTPKSPKSPANTIRSSSGAATNDTSPSSIAAQEDDAFPLLSLNLSGMQREILQMAAADQDTFWRRLTEEWGAWADAALYKELEMERKRWLLSALYSINPLPDTGMARTAAAEHRILAFFETHASASYIAALNAGVPVHHMAPSPLPTKLFSNIVPMPVVGGGTVYKTALSAMPQAFSHIYAQPLPVLVSASDIPLVLRSMHRALKPQGTLHLLLIDPVPARSSTGPRLQAWLDEHLMLNLERLFRCMSPTRLFPTWLRDAHFQVGTAAKVVCEFQAVFKDDDDVDNKADKKGQQAKDALATAVAEEEATLPAAAQAVQSTLPALPAQKTPEEQAAETVRKQKRLQSLVGQKLWQETWGSYVTAARWWWEDEACREECLRLGTVWEYHIVDAVRKDRYVVSPL